MGTFAEQSLEEISRAWSELMSRVDALGDDRGWERKTPSGWTAKEMLSHVAFWDEASVPVILYMFRGQEIPRRDWFGSGFQPPEDRDWPPANEHNAREAAWGRERSVPEVRERMERAHAASVAAVDTISDDEAPRYEQYLKDHAAHYREHATDLAGLEA